MQPQLEAGGQDILARLIGRGNVAGEMSQAGLVGVRMALLRAIAIGAPDLGSVSAHQGPDYDGTSGRRGVMDNRPGAAKHPMIGVGALDPDARLIRGDGPVALGCKGALRPAQPIHQAALADGETEQVRDRALQPLGGEGLVGLEVGGHRVQPRPERRCARGLWDRGDDPRSAGWAAHRQAPMLGDARCHLRQLNLLVNADRLSRQIPHQDG